MGRRRNRPILFGAVLLCALACDLEPPQVPQNEERCLELPATDGVEVARVGKTALTTERLEERIYEQGQAAARRYVDPVRLRKFVEDQIRFELLAYAALERDLHRDPDVIEAARKVMVRKLLERDLSGEALGRPVNEDEVRRYYERNTGYYLQPAMRRIAHIQLAPTEEGRTLAVTLLDQLDPRPEDDRFFRQLVLRHSLDAETRARGGELLFKTHADLVDDFGLSFANRVFSEADDALVAQPVQSTRGWHVVTVLSRRDELARPLEEVREEIVEKLLEKQRASAFDKYLNTLRERHPVVLHDHRLPELASSVRARLREGKP
ncbi:MAG: peptidyl-prolyl cis-trans isomerase [Myxococcota bacterium]